jgi:hypothetical protein
MPISCKIFLWDILEGDTWEKKRKKKKPGAIIS